MRLENYAPRDPEYLRLLMTFDLDRVDGDLLPIANTVNRQVKGAQVCILDDMALFSVEMLVAPPGCLPTGDTLAAVLPRAMAMVVNAASRMSTELTLHGIERASSDSDAAS